MELGGLNLYENMYHKNQINTNNDNSYKLNHNPYNKILKTEKKIDNNSLEFIKEMAKSDRLINKNLEEIDMKNQKNIKLSKRKSTTSDFKIKKINKVKFKENIVEPEEKQGMYIILIFRKIITINYRQ